WSATSYKALRHEALACDRWNLLHPGETPKVPYVTQVLGAAQGPVVAVTDFMRLVPDQIARWVPQGLTPLGTDGYGRSDTRKALRRFFEIDAECVAFAALAALAKRGAIDGKVPGEALGKLGIDPEKAFALVSCACRVRVPSASARRPWRARPSSRGCCCGRSGRKGQWHRRESTSARRW